MIIFRASITHIAHYWKLEIHVYLICICKLILTCNLLRLKVHWSLESLNIVINCLNNTWSKLIQKPGCLHDKILSECHRGSYYIETTFPERLSHPAFVVQLQHYRSQFEIRWWILFFMCLQLYCKQTFLQDIRLL